MLAWPLLFVYSGLVGAFVVRLIAPSAYVLASVSNLSYVMAGLACIPAMQTQRRRKAGVTPRGAMPLLILGTASAAHHARPRGGLAAHHLDIVFGWFLVMHLAHSSIAVGVRFLVSMCDGTTGGTLDRVADAAMYALLATGAVLMFSHYDTLYDDQVLVYLLFGIPCAVGTGCCRLLLAYDEQSGFTRASLGTALVETAAIALALVAALFAQGELLGRDLVRDKGMANEPYNLFHGSWHALIACVAVMVYVRLADVEALIDAIECGVKAEPVTQWSGTDAIALGTLGAYGGMVWALKETDAHTDLAFVLVAVYLMLVVPLAAALAMFLRTRAPRPDTQASAPQAFSALYPSLSQL